MNGLHANMTPVSIPIVWELGPPKKGHEQPLTFTVDLDEQNSFSRQKLYYDLYRYFKNHPNVWVKIPQILPMHRSGIVSKLRSKRLNVVYRVEYTASGQITTYCHTPYEEEIA